MISARMEIEVKKMTKQEAIEAIERLGVDSRGYPKLKEAFDMAIEALSAQLDNNSTKVDNENVDLIRRQDAIDIIDVDKMKPEIAPSLGSTAERDFKIYNQSCNKHIELIKQLTSVQPEHDDEVTFWKKRANEYEALLCEITAEIVKGMTVDSIIINKDGIVLKDSQPERKGEWVDGGDPLMLRCSKCGYRVMRYNNTNFCPNCGDRKR